MTHVSHDYCVANEIEINPIAKLVNIEGTGGDSIEYLGYAEASLSLPMGSHTCNIEGLLLVLPTTEYLKKVPVSVGTTITDMVVDFINQHKPENMSKSWKVVCCATDIPGSLCNHSPIVKEPSKQLSQSHCHPSAPLLLKATLSSRAMA